MKVKICRQFGERGDQLQDRRPRRRAQASSAIGVWFERCAARYVTGRWATWRSRADDRDGGTRVAAQVSGRAVLREGRQAVRLRRSLLRRAAEVRRRSTVGWRRVGTAANRRVMRLPRPGRASASGRGIRCVTPARWRVRSCSCREQRARTRAKRQGTCQERMFGPSPGTDRRLVGRGLEPRRSGNRQVGLSALPRFSILQDQPVAW